MAFLRLMFVFLGVFTLHMGFSAKSSPTFQTRKAFILEYFETCDNKVYPWMLANFTCIRNGTFLYVSGESVVIRDLRDPALIRIQVDRCKDKSNSDTCVHFTTLNWPDLCLANNIVPFIRDLYQAHSPPMSCPPKKNHYFIKNKKTQIDSIATFLAQGSGTASLVRIRINAFEGNQLILCQNVGLRMTDVKIRT